MGKISKSLKALGMILRNPYLLNRVLEDNEVWERYLGKNFPGITALPEIPLSGFLNESSGTISPFSFLDGGSLPTDLALLKGLALKTPGCKYFEIGTWKGESVANISPVAAECITMDLPDEEKRAIGMSEEYILQHAAYSNTLGNVTHLKANSFHFDFSSLNSRFDLVFIDGDHHYNAVLNDTQQVFRHLVHEKSIVVWHDYAYNPEKVRFEVFAAILDSLPETKRKNLFHVANTLCAVYLPEATAQRPVTPPLYQVKLRVLP